MTPCRGCGIDLQQEIDSGAEHEAACLASKLEAVRDYAEYRKDYSPCCRDILELLTGEER